jgi:hypothetical protein
MEECMAYGDPQRTWFPEMIQKLRLEWNESLTIPDLMTLCDSLDSMLHEIRATRNICSPIIKCPKCGKVGPSAERHVSVRAMILSLSRFNIVDPERVKILEKKWAVYRKENGLDLYGKTDLGEARSSGCLDSNGD